MEGPLKKREDSPMKEDGDSPKEEPLKKRGDSLMKE